MIDFQGAAHALEGAQERNGNIALPSIMWSVHRPRISHITRRNLAQDYQYLGVFLYLVAQKLVSGKIAVTKIKLNLQSISTRNSLAHCQPSLDVAGYRCYRTCRWTALRTSPVKAMTD